jgi:hypothetical protein
MPCSHRNPGKEVHSSREDSLSRRVPAGDRYPSGNTPGLSCATNPFDVIIRFDEGKDSQPATDIVKWLFMDPAAAESGNENQSFSTG